MPRHIQEDRWEQTFVVMQSAVAFKNLQAMKNDSENKKEDSTVCRGILFAAF